MRVVSRAFKATFIKELEAETYTSLIDIYYAELQAKHIRKIYASPAGIYIQEQCRMISSRIQRRKPFRITSTIVPIIQEKLGWAGKREAILGTESRKAIAKE